MTRCPECKRTDWHHSQCPEYQRQLLERTRERVRQLEAQWIPQNPAWNVTLVTAGDHIRLHALGVRW